ncbi:heavy-metal-associated domain-containing protein [bacterium]|nr:heavy-metal-associated domain-containing protein [bacterium]
MKIVLSHSRFYRDLLNEISKDKNQRFAENQNLRKRIVRHRTVSMAFIFLFLTFYASPGRANHRSCFRVEGMVCGKCVKKVEGAFKKKLGIQKTIVFLKKGEVVFESAKPLSQAPIKKQFEAINLTAEEIPCEQE